MEQLTKKQSKGLEYESFIMDWFCENKKMREIYRNADKLRG